MTEPATLVLDSFALLAYLQDVPVALRIEKLLRNAAQEASATTRSFFCQNWAGLWQNSAWTKKTSSATGRGGDERKGDFEIAFYGITRPSGFYSC